MNNQKQKNFKKKKNDIKQKRSQIYRGNEKPYGKVNKPFHQKGFKYENVESDYVYRKKQEDDKIWIYKQDLIQKGFSVSEKKEPSNKYKEIIQQKFQCFNQSKRQVILTKEIIDEKSMTTLNIEEIKQDFEKLIENEDIPDWYLQDADGISIENNFDFGGTIERTQTFQKQFNETENIIESKNIPQLYQINGFPLQENASEFQDLQDMDFAQLDKYLEQKAQQNKKEEQSSEDKQSQKSDKIDSSNEKSKNYFNNLKKNIQNYFMNSSKEDFEDSEESFQDTLGFHYQGVRNMNPQLTPNPAKQEIIKQKHEEELKKEEILKEIEEPIIEQKQEEEKPQPQIQEQIQQQQEEKTIEEKPQDNQEEFEKRKQIFIEKYGYMDQLLNQIVYEILHSKQRTVLNKFSVNGFNQKSVESYCQNQYKIFSLYTQGNIIPKVWFYRDKSKNVLGPFMSYDMDIWNDEKNYFSDSVEIALLNANGPFHSLVKYLNRDPEIIQIIEDYSSKNLLNQEIQKQKKNKNQNQQNQRKKQYQKRNFKDNQHHQIDEEFPSLNPNSKQNQQTNNTDYQQPNQDFTKNNKKEEFQEIHFDVQSSQQDNSKKVEENLPLNQEKSSKQNITSEENKQNQPIKKTSNVQNEELTNDLKGLLGLQIILNI